MFQIYKIDDRIMRFDAFLCLTGLAPINTIKSHNAKFFSMIQLIYLVILIQQKK